MSEDDMKYLAMRAKKMTARMPDVPSPEELKASFDRKGDSITLGQAQELVVAVEQHRAKMGITPSAQKARGNRTGEASTSKPESKEELSELASRVAKLESAQTYSSATHHPPEQKTTRRYG